jgi:selenocysteine-specific translation elongation factor
MMRLHNDAVFRKNFAYLTQTDFEMFFFKKLKLLKELKMVTFEELSKIAELIEKIKRLPWNRWFMTMGIGTIVTGKILPKSMKKVTLLK